MKIVVHWLTTDEHLKWASQIGVDGTVVFPASVPGLLKDGCPDLQQLINLKQRFAQWGIEICRYDVPPPRKHMLKQPGGKQEIDSICATIECLGQAAIPLATLHFTFSELPGYGHPHSLAIETTHQSIHRGGYTYRGFDLERRKMMLAENPLQAEALTREEHWDLCSQVYERVIPLAEKNGVRVAIHPSDPPIPGAPFDSLGWHRVLDAFPSPCNGLLYCVGTRHEAGGTRLVLDEINHYGRLGKIFYVHFRNVRGSLPAAGGFEEVLLDDGDMNMFEILLALRKVGYDGALSPDHYPTIEGGHSASYSVGYIKALLAAMAA